MGLRRTIQPRWPDDCDAESSDRTDLLDAKTGRVSTSIACRTEQGFGRTAFEFSPDGRRIATSNEDQKTVELWDTTDGRRLLALERHTNPVRSLAFSPTGQRIATACADETTIRIWDTTTGRQTLASPWAQGTGVRRDLQPRRQFARLDQPRRHRQALGCGHRP